MRRSTQIKKIAFIGNYPPRKCGIATFTHDLRNSVAARFPDAECLVVPVNDIPEKYDYPAEARYEIRQDDPCSYLRAAEFLNFGNIDVACLQHEYGIFGGRVGDHILSLLRNLRMPIVSTLHTVLDEPSADQRRVLIELAALSTRVVVMTARGRSLLQERYDVPASKIDLIAHGIPDLPFIDPNFYKDKLGVAGKLVALTFGLLSPNKGIEHMLRALPDILRDFPSLVYIVLGATHPNLVRERGEAYRSSLEQMTRDLGITRNVIFHNRFVELAELTEYIVAADVYVTPYLNPGQSVSGTLAYSFGCGKAVVSTPYRHAEELLADGAGVLVPFGDSKSLAREIRDLLRDEPRRNAMRKNAYLAGREMIWSHVAGLYMDSFENARNARIDPPARPRRDRAKWESRRPLPDWNLDHLKRLTDSTGIFQFADHGIPNLADGYCSDDCARALLLTVYLEELGRDDSEIERLSTTYAGFLQYAFDRERKRFRNFLTFDRRWRREINVGSDDCQGRVVWALGACVRRSKRAPLQFWAARIFEEAIEACSDNPSPRSWALCLLGIRDYLFRLEGDRRVARIGESLARRLLDRFAESSSTDWPWFEDSVTYDNARLPQALLAFGSEEAREVGLKSLKWLVETQKSHRGDFRPIGSDGFYVKGNPPARFDQQPIEALATVSACLEAARRSEESFWIDEARLAFDWYLGRNDLDLELYNSTTGGCRDGLLPDRVNQNEGAESTLAFLLSLAEMNLFEISRGP